MTMVGHSNNLKVSCSYCCPTVHNSIGISTGLCYRIFMYYKFLCKCAVFIGCYSTCANVVVSIRKCVVLINTIKYSYAACSACFMGLHQTYVIRLVCFKTVSTTCYGNCNRHLSAKFNRGFRHIEFSANRSNFKTD